jgi:hypothetical protein
VLVGANLTCARIYINGIILIWLAYDSKQFNYCLCDSYQTELTMPRTDEQVVRILLEIYESKFGEKVEISIGSPLFTRRDSIRFSMLDSDAGLTCLIWEQSRMIISLSWSG